MGKNGLSAIALMLIMGMLLFGCNGNDGNGTTTVGLTPTQPTSTPSLSTTPTPTPTTAQNPAPTPTTEQGLEGMSLTELAALGVPINCNFTLPQDAGGAKGTIQVFGGMMRTETESVSNDTSEKLVTILKGGLIYVDSRILASAMGDLAANVTCKWITYPLNGQQADSYDVSSQLSPSDLACAKGSFSDAVFETAGKACTSDEFMQEIANNIG